MSEKVTPIYVGSGVEKFDGNLIECSLIIIIDVKTFII